MNFAEQVKKWTVKVKADQKAVIEVLVDDVLTTLKDRTPVDTGALRDAWVVKQEGSRTSIQNPLPYMAVIEFGGYPNPPVGGDGKTDGGYSTQAPHGVIGITAVELPAKLRKAVRTVRK